MAQIYSECLIWRRFGNWYFVSILMVLILLTKKDCLSMWMNFRPIGHCNISNKALTKLMVLRLYTFLPCIISTSYSGFVLGWVLYDNIMLVQQLIHDINRYAR